jgi:putative transposase
METDKDHIHYLIESVPKISASQIVRVLKKQTTKNIWKIHNKYLSKQFWKENTFWIDGYFICSIGNVSEKMLVEYINNQG